MKTLLMTVMILLCLDKSSTLSSQQSKQYFPDALAQGIDSYLEQNNFQNKKKYFIIIIKLINCNSKRGEFSISHIRMDAEVADITASHYLYYNNRIILIRTDGLFYDLLKDNNIARIDSTTRKGVFENLAGTNGAGTYIGITGQPSPVMVVRYKRRHIEVKNYFARWSLEEKYMYYNDKR